MDYYLKKNKGRIFWTEEQVEYVISKYEKELASIASIARMFSCDPDAIRGVLRKAGIQLRNRREDHPRKSDYFHAIDSSEKAYWLGLLYADGCVASDKTGNNRISLGMIDKDHVEKFLVAIGAVNNKITTVKPKGFANASDTYYASVYDAEMREDLITLGCVPQKTKVINTIPDIPKEFLFDFVRGYFDGDGCIRFDKNRNCYRMSFVCGSEEFLKSIQHVLGVSHLSISHGKSGCSASYFSIAAKSDLLRIITAMYEHSTEQSRLSRKYQKCQDCLAWIGKKIGGTKIEPF